MNKNETDKAVYRATIKLLMVQQETYMQELQKRLQIVGYQFSTEKQFKEFNSKNISVEHHRFNTKVAYLFRGKPNEMLLAWWR